MSDEQHSEEATKQQDPAPSTEQTEVKREEVEDSKPSQPRDEQKDYSDLPERKRVTVATGFHYDVDLEGEESYANAAQIKAIEDRNKKLLAQIDALEEKVYSSEESRLKLQKELINTEEEAAENKSLLDLRDAQSAQLRKEYDEFSASVAEEVSKLAELESEKRKIEHKKTVTETLVEENKRAQSRLDAALKEIEEVRQKVATLIDQKGAAVSNKDRASRQVGELEQKLRAEFFRAREMNKRTVTDLDGMIEVERNRGQQAIDYVKKSLKAQIKSLEVQIDLNRETDLDLKKEKRRVAREVKQVNRKLEEQKSQSTHNERHIESLNKQHSALKERHDKDYQTKVTLDTEIADLEREVGTLTAQFNAACRINAKLGTLTNVLVASVDPEEAGEASAPVAPKEQPKQDAAVTV